MFAKGLNIHQTLPQLLFPNMFLLTLTESLGLNVAYLKIFTLTFYKNHILEDVFILGKKCDQRQVICFLL